MENKKNIKIKRRKHNLYNKKKSKLRQALTIFLTVVILAGLGVVGYGLGKPIMEFLNSKESQPSSDDSGWSPPETVIDSSESSETSVNTSAPANETSTADNNSSQEELTSLNSYVLPQDAVLSSDSLNSAIAAAKADGYDSVAVTLKDNTGYFLYKTEIDGVKDSAAVSGTLTADQICNLIKSAGLKPQAIVNTLKDHSSSRYISGINFRSVDGWGWLDNYADRGGKPWLSPFLDNTRDYIADITTELAEAGFEYIILKNTIFPSFNSTDYSILAYIGDSQKRLDALWNVVSASAEAAKAHGAELLVEMSAEALFSESKLSTTAELAGDKTKLLSVRLLIDYSDDSQNPYLSAKSFIGKMSSSFPDQDYSVMIKRDGLSSASVSESVKAFSEEGIPVCS